MRIHCYPPPASSPAIEILQSDEQAALTPHTITGEIGAIKSAIFAAHGVRVRFVISTFPGPLAPLKGGPLTYTLDSADPEKFKAIVDDMQHRAHEPVAKLLPSTLVMGRNYATERLAALYRKFEIDGATNFLDIDANRALLYTIALAGQDLEPWLTDDPTEEALSVASFMQARLQDFRDKFTLLLPKDWAAAAHWTRRQFAGSIHLIVDEKPNPRQFHKATDPFQDRVFLVVQRKGESNPDANAINALRHAGYPMAEITFNASEPVSRYIRLIEHTAAMLRTLYPVHDIASADLVSNPRATLQSLKTETPESLANVINHGVKTRTFTCGEIVFFGDLGRQALLRKTLDTGARLLFRTPFKMPAGVFEGPSDMLAGPGGCFTLLVLSATQNRFALAGFEPDHHIADFLLAKLTLERKHRLVRAILVKDLSAESIAGLVEFFSRTAKNIHGEIQSS